MTLLPLLCLMAFEDPTVLCDNGGWCWYQDERAIVHAGQLIFGTVSHRAGVGGETRHGDIQVTGVDLASGAGRTVVLAPRLGADDHNLPALLALPDGRILALYSKHSGDALIRSRVTQRPGDISEWAPEQTIARPIRVCYSNLFGLPARGDQWLINFYRGEGFDPNAVISSDGGATWREAGRLVFNPGDEAGRIRPYAKYASNGLDTIHFVTTEGHPQERPKTSILHGMLRGDEILDSWGRPLGRLGEGIDVERLTTVFAGTPEAKAWTMDLHVDDDGRPYTVYSVHRSDDDHRYRYAWFDGRAWHDHELAFAGTRLYRGENHYTGLAALDPHDLDTVYLSTNADPRTGEPLVSAADGRRHWEIFRARTRDGGGAWTFEAVTADSTTDNLRPIVPIDPGGPVHLLWLRGTYTTYTDYNQQVVGLTIPREAPRVRRGRPRPIR